MITKAELKKELHKLGIKTYKRKNGEVVAKMSEIKKVLASLDEKKNKS